MSDPIPFKGRNISITAVLLQDIDTANIDEALSAKIAQVPAGFFTTQPLVADLSALEGFQADAKWLKTLKRIFERHSLCLVGISGGQIVARQKYLKSRLCQKQRHLPLSHPCC